MLARRLAWIAIGTVLGLVAFECALQVVAFVIWSSSDSQAVPARPVGDGPVILCAGDSFTYGLGAIEPDQAYPQQLEKRLAERGVHADVVNCGWPGNSSRDVVRDLPAQLESLRPRLVCLLIGTNDLYFRPGLARDLGPATVDRGFPMRLRTLRLLQIASASRSSEPGNPHNDDFIGTWHNDDLELTFEPDGHLLLAGKRFRWFRESDRLMMADESGWRLPVTLQVVADAMTLERTPWWPRMELTRGATHASAETALAKLAMQVGDFASARTLLEQDLESRPRALEPREMLVNVFVALDDHDGAQRHLQSLEALHAETREPNVSVVLAVSLRTVGRWDSSWATIELLLRRSDLGPHTLGRVAAVAVELGTDRPGQRNEISAALRAAAASRRATKRLDHAVLLRADADLQRHDAPVRALRSLLETIHGRGDAEEAAWWCRARAFEPDAEALQTAIATATAERPAAAAWFARFAEVLADDPDRALGVLETHLEMIDLACRAAGARLVLLTYPGGPFDKPGLAATQKRVADRLALGLIDTRRAFDSLPAERRGLHFVADGHCSSRGYALVADLVAPHAETALRD